MSMIVRTIVLAAALSVGIAGQAFALTFKSISGKWCGLTTNYIFSQSQLTVSFHDGTPTRRFKVTSYEYLGDTIKMHWESNNEKLYTDFSEFSADNKTMAQQKNDAGPRRPFKRCK